MNVTDHILQRTFHMRYGERYGTCFTVDIEYRRYILTARHLVDSIRDDEVIEIRTGDEDNRDIWKSIKVKLVGYGYDGDDIAILAPEYPFGGEHPIIVTGGDIILSEDVYFLGYPYGRAYGGFELNYGLPLPLVKRATISAINNKANLIVLDGNGNPGFSGGPVVRRFQNDSQTVIGVMVARHQKEQEVRPVSDEMGRYTYSESTGIAFAYSCKDINKIVASNPKGASIL